MESVVDSVGMGVDSAVGTVVLFDDSEGTGLVESVVNSVGVESSLCESVIMGLMESVDVAVGESELTGIVGSVIDSVGEEAVLDESVIM